MTKAFLVISSSYLILGALLFAFFQSTVLLFILGLLFFFFLGVELYGSKIFTILFNANNSWQSKKMFRNNAVLNSCYRLSIPLPQFYQSEDLPQGQGPILLPTKSRPIVVLGKNFFDQLTDQEQEVLVIFMMLLWKKETFMRQMKSFVRSSILLRPWQKLYSMIWKKKGGVGEFLESIAFVRPSSLVFSGNMTQLNDSYLSVKDELIKLGQSPKLLHMALSKLTPEHSTFFPI